MKAYILNDRNEPVPVSDMLEVTRWLQKAGEHRRIVMQENVGAGTRVSTVFLMFDHAINGGPPVLFETMVFGGPADQDQWRYHTWAEALEGHHQTVAAVRELIEAEAALPKPTPVAPAKGSVVLGERRRDLDL